jgi:transcription termination factor Rho
MKENAGSTESSVKPTQSEEKIATAHSSDVAVAEAPVGEAQRKESIKEAKEGSKETPKGTPKEAKEGRADGGAEPKSDGVGRPPRRMQKVSMKSNGSNERSGGGDRPERERPERERSERGDRNDRNDRSERGGRSSNKSHGKSRSSHSGSSHYKGSSHSHGMEDEDPHHGSPSLEDIDFSDINLTEAEKADLSSYAAAVVAQLILDKPKFN